MPLFAFGYSDTTTHPALSKEAVEFFNESQDEELLSERDKFAIMRGSVAEDESFRFMRHFYDPTRNVGLTAFTAGTGRTVWPSAKEWAEDTISQAEKSSVFRAMIGKTLARRFSSPTDYSWERAIFDFVHGDRERALESLGHVLHLLQDMTVPDHTRDDPHPPIGEFGSPYEGYTKKFSPFTIPDISDSLWKRGASIRSYQKLGDIFDATAHYSNANFYSKDRVVGAYNLPDPEEVPIGEDFVLWHDPDGNEFHLARVFNKRRVITGEVIREYSLVDDEGIVLGDYWRLLSERAVRAGAALIDLFFREVEHEQQSGELLAKNQGAGERFAAQVVGGFRAASSAAEVPATRELADTVHIATESDVVSDRDAPGSSELRALNDLMRLARAKVSRIESGLLISQQETEPSLVPQDIGDGPDTPRGHIQESTESTVKPLSQNETVFVPFQSRSPGFGGGGEVALAQADSRAGSQGMETQVSRQDAIPNTGGGGEAQDTGQPSKPEDGSPPLDMTAPDIFLTLDECLSPSSSTTCVVSTTTIHARFATSASDLARYSYSINGAAFVDTSQTTFRFSIPTVGSSTIRVLAIDTAGNSSESVSREMFFVQVPVVINEIAWAGTPSSSADEWIELANTTGQPLSLSGLRLYSTTDGSPDISLSGTIPANGFFVIERKNSGETNEATESPISDVQADMWTSFGFGLKNTGEQLALAIGSTTIDQTPTLGVCSGWCGGNTNPLTMERLRPTTDGTLAASWGTNLSYIRKGIDKDGVALGATAGVRNSISYRLPTNSITVDTTITKDNGPYVVANSETIHIDGGATLAIEPGTIFKFVPGYSGIDGSGGLVVRGTANEPAVFTSFNDDAYGGDTNYDGTSTVPYSASWIGIELKDTTRQTLFDHAIVRYGGFMVQNRFRDSNLSVERGAPLAITDSVFEYAGTVGVRVSDTDAVITKSTIGSTTRPGGAGLHAFGKKKVKVADTFFPASWHGAVLNDLPIELTGNIFIGQQGAPITMNSLQGGSVISGNTGYTSVSGNRFGVQLNGDISSPGATSTFGANGFDYFIDRPVRIPATSTVVFGPGSVVKMIDNGLSVSGRLEFAGTATAPISVSSLYDNTVGTQVEIGATREPSYRSYQQIELLPGSSSKIDHALIKYLEYGARYNDSSVDLANVHFEKNLYGIYGAVDTPVIRADNLTFLNNGAATSTIPLR